MMFDKQTGRSRRQMLQQAACGFGSLALAGLCADQVQAASRRNPLAAKPPHLPARAKRIIFIFMQGGPSHVDTFDYKPRLARDDGKKIPFRVARTRKVSPQRVMNSPWRFRRYGQCGRWVSELFPHTARHVDDLCFLQGLHTEGVAHGPATLFLHTGATNLIRPSMGAWVMYGLGTENRNLPGFVTVAPPPTKGGPRNYSNAFLPAVYQGTALGRAGLPASEARFHRIRNRRLSSDVQREQFQLLRRLNQTQLAQNDNDDRLEAVIDSFELAFRMQHNAPGVIDLSRETRATLKEYGIGEKPTDDFGRQCLMARRFAEAGVRYIQINYADLSNSPRWDQHSHLERHAIHAAAVDKPVSALLADLKRRGLLEDTLVWWGGEFGRTPFAQGTDGRDHNPDGFTVWLAGGGVRPGFSFGATDEYGQNAVTNRLHMRDLHATILYLLGLDHQRLTYRYSGRDFRLTDVAGQVAHEIMV